MREPKKRGGARAGAGKKPLDGAANLKRKLVMLDPASEAFYRDLGGGELSLGIRRGLLVADFGMVASVKAWPKK